MSDLVDNRDSRREEKVLDEKKRQKKAKIQARVDDTMDKGGRPRKPYRRAKSNWQEIYEDGLDYEYDV